MATGILPGPRGLTGVIGLTGLGPAASSATNQPRGALHGVIGLSGTGSAPGEAAASPNYSAEHLARVFGTEEDPVNCSFYFKVGVCRNGFRCPKKHNHPIISQTLLLTNMYPVPQEAIAIANGEYWNDDMYDRCQKHVEAFYEEVAVTLSEYGEVAEVIIVENTEQYMLGNVYVKFVYEDDAAKALKGLTGRYYMGKLINAEYAPVTDFREARCRGHHETRCSRLGCCRFLHFKHIPKAVKRRVAREIYREQKLAKRLGTQGDKGQSKLGTVAPGEKGQGKHGQHSDEQLALEGQAQNEAVETQNRRAALEASVALSFSTIFKRNTGDSETTATDGQNSRTQREKCPAEVYDPEEMPAEEHPRRKSMKDGTTATIQDGQGEGEEMEAQHLRRRRTGEVADPKVLNSQEMGLEECRPRKRKRNIMDMIEKLEQLEHDPEEDFEHEERPRRRRMREAEGPRMQSREEFDPEERRHRRRRRKIMDATMEEEHLAHDPEAEVEQEERPRRKRMRESTDPLMQSRQDFDPEERRHRRRGSDVMDPTMHTEHLVENPEAEVEQEQRPRRRRARETLDPMIQNSQELDLEEHRHRRRRRDRMDPTMQEEQLEHEPEVDCDQEDRPRRKRTRDSVDPMMQNSQEVDLEERRHRRRREDIIDPVVQDEQPENHLDAEQDREERRRRMGGVADPLMQQFDPEECQPHRRRRDIANSIIHEEQLEYDPEAEIEQAEHTRRRRLREAADPMLHSRHEFDPEPRRHRRRRRNIMDPTMQEEQLEYDADERPRRRRVREAEIVEREFDHRDRPRRRRARAMGPEMYDDQEEYDESRIRRCRRPESELSVDDSDL